jgi:hypothetical protein
MGSAVTRRRANFSWTAVGLGLVAAVLLAGPSNAAADTMPWQYYAGLPNVASGSTWTMTITNESASPQTVAIAFGGPHTIAAGAQYQLASPCTGGGSCLEPAAFDASSPDLVAYAQGTLQDGSATTPMFLPASAFAVIGPGGTQAATLGGLTTSNGTALSGLITGQTQLESLLGPVGGQLGSVQSSLTSLGGQVGTVGSSLSSLRGEVGLPSGGAGTGPSTTTLGAQVSSLTAKVNRLGNQIAALTKALAPKPKTKKKKKRHA